VSIIENDVRDEIASATCWAVAQGVAVEPWPPDPTTPRPAHEADRRPVLYLVEPGAPPPAVNDELVGWLQLPGSADDLLTRARTLAGRARTAGMVLTYVDSDDVLRVGDRLAVLSPVEARIMRILLENVGRVVSRERINRELWPWKHTTDFGTLNSRVRLLRTHIDKLPLRIHTVRRRGLLLQITSSDRLAPDE
jgi:Transcriptional regulatory protein, C terminal